MEPQIRLHNTSLPSPLPGSPSFIFHLTLLQNTLFIWVGTGQPTDPSTSPDEMITPAERNIAQDWAVSMPSRPNLPIAATPIYRGPGDLALPMSKRLSKKFPQSQIHLSLSLPPSLVNTSGPSIDPYGSKVLLVMEKKLGAWVQEVLSKEGL